MPVSNQPRWKPFYEVDAILPPGVVVERGCCGASSDQIKLRLPSSAVPATIEALRELIEVLQEIR